MPRHKFIYSIYLIAVLSISIASFLNLDVQNLLRIPFVGFKWIDIAIIILMVSWFKRIRQANLLKKSQTIISFCFIFLIFEIYQLISSWGAIDLASQISFFICTLGIFVIIDLCAYKLTQQQILNFLRFAVIGGCAVTIVSTAIYLFLFSTGRTIVADGGIRVSLDITGSKETVSTSVLTPLVYSFSLYFLQRKSNFWERIIFTLAILCIYVSLVYSFHRGTLLTILLITVLYVLFFSKRANQAVFKLISILLLIVTSYLLFGDFLQSKGYDPIKKIGETAEYAADVHNPNWDKGRSLSRTYALAAWGKSIWTGFGYDELSNHGLPKNFATAHNFIVTSLFHKGIIGTFIYLFILFKLYLNAFRLWLIIYKKRDYASDIMKLLIIVSFIWIIPFWTQEVIWEKYSLVVQFLYLGLITNYYHQLKLSNEISKSFNYHS